MLKRLVLHDPPSPETPMGTHLLAFVWIGLSALPASAKERAGEEFETWEHYLLTRDDIQVRQESGVRAWEVRPAGKAIRATGRAAADEEFDPIITFGAGVSYSMPYRFSDGALGDLLAPELTVSISPLQRHMDIGIDLVLDRHGLFVLRPNLKFYFVKNEAIGVYAEGSAPIVFQEAGVDAGAGMGLGVQIGLMEHLAVDLRALAAVFFLEGAASSRLLDTDALDAEAFVGFLSFGARLVARF
jgi:hypothetical protein